MDRQIAVTHDEADLIIEALEALSCALWGELEDGSFNGTDADYSEQQDTIRRLIGRIA